jgi:hypothetical protein
MVFKLHSCVLYRSQNIIQHLPYITSTDWFFITKVETVYCAARAESLYMRNYVRTFLKGSCDHLPSQLLTENILYGAQYKAKFSFQRGKEKSGGCLTSKALMALPSNTTGTHLFPLGSN